MFCTEGEYSPLSGGPAKISRIMLLTPSLKIKSTLSFILNQIARKFTWYTVPKYNLVETIDLRIVNFHLQYQYYFCFNDVYYLSLSMNKMIHKRLGIKKFSTIFLFWIFGIFLKTKGFLTRPFQSWQLRCCTTIYTGR